MKFIETKLQGAYIIENEPIIDERGFFCRCFCANEFTAAGLNPTIAQSSLSYNQQKGTLRGMHFQQDPLAEVKLVNCLKGAIYDVILDLRPESPTFKEWFATELTADNNMMLYIPEGFAHGFITLENDSLINYNISEFYNADLSCGVRYNDPAFNIEWALEPTIISAKDLNYPDFDSRQSI